MLIHLFKSVVKTTYRVYVGGGCHQIININCRRKHVINTIVSNQESLGLVQPLLLVVTNNNNNNNNAGGQDDHLLLELIPIVSLLLKGYNERNK